MDENSYAIASLVNGLLGNALDGMDGKVTQTKYTDADGNEYFFADKEVVVAEDGTITAIHVAKGSKVENGSPLFDLA